MNNEVKQLLRAKQNTF